MRTLPAWKQDNATPTIKWDVAAARYGLQWQPALAPTYYKLPHGEMMQNPDEVTIYRDDTWEALGRAKGGYTVITNDDLGRIVETSLQDERYHIEHIAVLHHGRAIWVTVDLGEKLEIPGDPSPLVKKLHFATTNDGSGSLRTGPGVMRISCQNMIAMAAAGMRNSSLYRQIKHTKQAADIDVVADELHEHIKFCRIVTEQWHSEAVEMSQRKVDVKDFLHRWLPDPPKDASERVKSNQIRRRGMFTKVLNSDTNAGGNSAWAVLQAVTELDQHELPAHGADNRARRALEGGSGFTHRAQRILADMAS